MTPEQIGAVLSPYYGALTQAAIDDITAELLALLPGATETVQWGVHLLTKNGNLYTTRWNPGYGTGIYVPYTESQARWDASRDEPGFPASNKRLVTRTFTEYESHHYTEWMEVQS